MTDQMFFLVWFLSFGLYLVIYTWWIPIRTRKNIEAWLMSEESNETFAVEKRVSIVIEIELISGKLFDTSDFPQYLIRAKLGCAIAFM